jgi:hypothetical protein
MKLRSPGLLFVFILTFIAVILIIYTVLSPGGAPQPDAAPDIRAEVPPHYGLRVAASLLIGLAMVAGFLELNRAWGPFFHFDINLLLKRTPFSPPERQQRKRQRLGVRLGFLATLVVGIIIVAIASRPDRPPVNPGALLFGIILAAAGLAAATSLVNVYLVLRVLRPRNRQLMVQEPTPDDEQEAGPPPELEPLAQQLVIREYTRLGVATIRGSGKTAFIRYWIYSSWDAKVTAMLYFDPTGQRPALLLTSMFRDDALLETHHRIAIRIERPDYVAQSVSGGLNDMFAAHRERLAAFGEAHGAPLTIRSFEDYFAFRARLARRPHVDEWERATTRSLLGMPLISLILAVGFFAAALLLHFPSSEVTPVSCLIPIGLAPLVLAVMYTCGMVRGIVATRSPQADRESEGPVGG